MAGGAGASRPGWGWSTCSTPTLPGSAATIKTWRTTPFDRGELTRRYGSIAELRHAASAHAWRLAEAGSYLPEDVDAAVDSYCSAAGEF